jgi:serine/threonine protein phosphatase PrpC
MAEQLRVALGEYSDKGRKPINQDAHGSAIPDEPQLSSKGIAICLADGISSSDVSQIASQAAVSGFLADYYCTAEAWSAKKSALAVLSATNSWLHAQTRQSQFRFEKDKGYVCAFSAVVIKSNTAHIFHVGDTRVYRLRDQNLEQLSEDHRLWVSTEQSYLSRALGMNPQVDLDYRDVPVAPGDVFLLASDGAYEYVSNETLFRAIAEHESDLNAAAAAIARQAHDNGSEDNLTLQILRVDALPQYQASEIATQVAELPLPPGLQARLNFDGYQILREMHASHRSHVFLALDTDSNTQVIIKTPSVDLAGDQAYLERLLLEEWIARRLNNAHVLKAYLPGRKRNYLYTVSEYVEGQTLTQWLIDNPKPDLESVRAIVEQIGKGLRAFHRLEMLHQDLRPNNILIDKTGTVKIIDFGSSQVAGLSENEAPYVQYQILGTEQYSAPEYFLGEGGTPRSDLFSLGVITYQMLSGRLPYGTQVSRARTRTAQRKLRYRSVIDEDREVPRWIDEAIKKAVQPAPDKRYAEISEFMYDLRHPNPKFLQKTQPPIIERNPVLFWKSLALILCLILLVLVVRQHA